MEFVNPPMIEMDPDDGCCPKVKSNKRRCRNPAGQGTSHPGSGLCGPHEEQAERLEKATNGHSFINNPSGSGGPDDTLKQRRVRNRANDLVSQMKARAGFYGIRAEGTPEEFLLEEVARSAGVVRYLEDQIGSWEVFPSDRLGDLPELIVMSEHYQATSSQRVWLEVYLQERGHLLKVVKLALDAGIADRALRLAEQQADMMQQMINAAIDQLDLTDQQREQVPQVMLATIRRITASRYPNQIDAVRETALQEFPDARIPRLSDLDVR